MRIRVGSYFLSDRPLATLRKRERDYLCLRILPFIKADKTNRARLTFAMVLKASLITLLYWAAYMEHKFTFLNLNDLSDKVEPVI